MRRGGTRAHRHAQGSRLPAKGLAGEGGRGAECREPRAPGCDCMTATRQAAPPARSAMNSSSAFAEGGSDSFVRRAGRGFIISLYGALRSIKLYPVENVAVQKAL